MTMHPTARQAGHGRPGSDGGSTSPICFRRRDHYGATDAERRGIVRSMQLMSRAPPSRALRESTAARCRRSSTRQGPHRTVASRHIASLNATGQRVFGHVEAEITGRSSAFLLPHSPINDAARAARTTRCASRRHAVDLAAPETLGLHQRTHFPPTAVSKRS